MTGDDTMPTASPATRRLVALTAWITVAILLIGGVTLWQTLGTRGTVAAIDDSAVLAACRSELRSAVDFATAAVDETDGARDAIILDGLIAVAREDTAALAALVERAEEAQGLAHTALTDLHAAVDRYAEGVELSRTDPDAFTRRCQS